MASGSFNISTSNKYVSGKVDWSSASNTAGNYSNVTAWMYLSRTNAGHTTSGNGTFWLNIGGVGFSEAMHYTITQGSNTLMIAKVTGIPHNADGTKAVRIAISGNIPGAGLTVPEQWADVWLDTIPRTSRVTATGGSALGTVKYIRTNRAASNFWHILKLTIGGHTRTIDTGVGDGIDYVAPLDLANYITGGTYGVATITCETYVDGVTYIGTSTTNLNLSVPADIVPTIGTFTVTRVDGIVPSAWGIYVQGYSKATLAMGSVAGAYGSTITKYSITGHNLNSAASSDTTGFLTSTGTLTYTATVTDSRGRTATKTVSVTVQPYYTPSIDGSVTRCNSAGTVIEAGTYYKVRPTANFATCSGKNTITIAADYKQSSATSWVASGNVSNNVYSSALGGGALSTSFSYDIRLTVTDGLGNTSQVISKITSLFSHMSFKKGLKGFAVGKQMETDNLVDINMPTKIAGGLSVDTLNGKTVLNQTYPVGAIYMSSSSTSPATLFGGTWARLSANYYMRSGSSYTSGGSSTSGGTAITVAQMPNHTHGLTFSTNGRNEYYNAYPSMTNPQGNGTYAGWVDYTGGGATHTHGGITPLYYDLYIWRRTA